MPGGGADGRGASVAGRGGNGGGKPPIEAPTGQPSVATGRCGGRRRRGEYGSREHPRDAAGRPARRGAEWTLQGVAARGCPQRRRRRRREVARDRHAPLGGERWVGSGGGGGGGVGEAGGGGIERAAGPSSRPAKGMAGASDGQPLGLSDIKSGLEPSLSELLAMLNLQSKPRAPREDAPISLQWSLLLPVAVCTAWAEGVPCRVWRARASCGSLSSARHNSHRTPSLRLSRPSPCSAYPPSSLWRPN